MHLPCALLLIACAANAQATIRTREMSYRDVDDTRMVSYFIYDDSKPGIRPGVIVTYEWWGLNGYAEHRVRDLAEFSYSALIIDMYGGGKHIEHPQDTMAFTQAATRDVDAAKAHFLIGPELLKRQPQTDPSQITVIGYYFGGKTVLDMAHQDLSLAGATSFHDALGTATPASGGSVRAKILVEHGSADSLVPAKGLDALKQELSATSTDYRVVIQGSVKHGFTDPGADAHKGHGPDIGYDRQADRRSQTDLQAFLKDIFGQG